MRKRGGMKAQAALEFLTTYGWAFLVVLVMIGALAYFGVLNPSGLLPDKCIFGNGIGACVDYGVNATTMDVIIINNFGKTVTAASFNFSVSGNTGCSVMDYGAYKGQTLVSLFAMGTTMISLFGTGWAEDEQLILRVRCTSGSFTEGRIKETIRMEGTLAGSEYPVYSQGTVSLTVR
ncbi:MAG: hypothetical protein V1725_03865 [archaeon]